MSTCGLRPCLPLSRRCGSASFEVQNVPRALIPCIKAYFFALTDRVPPLSMALALLIRMSMPPK